MTEASEGERLHPEPAARDDTACTESLTRSERERAASERFLLEHYLATKAGWRGKRLSRDELRRKRAQRTAKSEPYTRGRDPLTLAAALDEAIRVGEWDAAGLAEARVVAEWERLVGARNAAHTEVTRITDGVVYVQCDSTAWTAELRRLRPEIVSAIQRELPSARVRDVRIQPPGAPSWKHGRLSVPGRGPRDTYN